MVALADPKRKSAHDVQESELPEVCFYANQVGNGRVFVQIRKKASKNTFAIWVSGGTKPVVADEKISRLKLEDASKTRRLLLEKIKIVDCDQCAILRILNEK